MYINTYIYFTDTGLKISGSFLPFCVCVIIVFPVCYFVLSVVAYIIFCLMLIHNII